MKIEIERTSLIDAPRERVYAYLADFSRHPEWAEPKHHLRLQPPAQVRVGATFTSIGKDLGRDSRNFVTITELVPNERIVYQADQDDGTRWRNELVFRSEGGATRVTKRVRALHLPAFHRVAFAILGAVVRAEGERIFQGDLARIKARIEAAPVGADSTIFATR